MTAAVDLVLPHLTSVRKRQPGLFSACCPAHADKGPSLSLRETPEGAILLYCFAGCTVAEIVAALGLEMHDLFPRRDKPEGSPKRTAKLLTGSQALKLLSNESMVIAVSGANVGHGVASSAADIERGLVAAGRINWMRDQTYGSHKND